jgi:aminotransferase in exopolysaccharide biosynthesis
MLDQISQFIREKFHTNDFIPLHEPRFIGSEKDLLNKTIESTFVSSVGEYVDQFEKNISSFTQSSHAIAVMNGTAALHLSMILAGVKPGDFVITQALTFVATCNAISYCNAEPILLDVDRKTLGLCPIALESWLDTNATLNSKGSCILKKSKQPIKACIPMHTFGHPVEIDSIVNICSRWNISVIQDAAESLGSLYKNTHTGTFGLMGTLSFNGNKIITTGGGGAILCNEETYFKGKHLSTTAKVPSETHFFHDQIGFNYRMPNLNAALGCAQLESLKIFLEKKRNLAMEYQLLFKGSDFHFFIEPVNCHSNYWLNTIFCQDKAHRDEFLSNMNHRKIMTRPIWTPMNKLPMFSNAITDGLVNTTWLEDRVVNIPSSVTI